MAFLLHSIPRIPINTTRWLEPLSSRQRKDVQISEKTQQLYAKHRSSEPIKLTQATVDPIFEKLLSLPGIRKEVLDLLKLHIPIQVVSSIPQKVLGKGQLGVVYEIEDEQGRPSALKICTEEVVQEKEGTLMQRTFSLCQSLAKVQKRLPNCPHLIKFQGLAYVEELDKWGVVYEKIDGKSFCLDDIKQKPVPKDRYRSLLNVAKGIACALQILDLNQWHYFDLHKENIMIRSDGTPILIDFPDKPAAPFWEGNSPVHDREFFGKMFLFALLKLTPAFDSEDTSTLSQHLIGNLSRYGVPYRFINVLTNCWKSTELNKQSWQEIIDGLNQVDFNAPPSRIKIKPRQSLKV